MNIPFLNPSSFGNAPLATTQQEVDPYAGLEQILNNLNPQVQQPQQGKLQTILDMIANAAAVGISNDPGQALAQQLQSRQQQQLFQQKIQQDRLNKIEDIKLNIAQAKAQDLVKEQQQFRFEQRQRVRQQEDRKADFNEKLELENRRFENEKAMELWKLDNLKDELDIRERVKLDYADDWFKIEEKLSKMRGLDKKVADAIELSSSYQLADPNADPTAFDTIAKKRLGIIEEALTPEEIKLLKNANAIINRRQSEKHSAEIGRLRQLASGSRGRGGGSGSADPQKVFLDTAKRNLANTIFDSQYVEDTNGRVMDLRNAPKDLFGQPDSTKIKRYLSPQENYQRSLQILGDMNNAGAIPQAQTQQRPTAADQGTNAPLRQELGTRINAMKQQGSTPQQINQLLQEAMQADPANAQIYQGFMTRERPTFNTMAPDTRLRAAYEAVKQQNPNLTFEQFKKQVNQNNKARK